MIIKSLLFWIIVASIALFLIITVYVLKLFIGGSNGGDSDQWGLKGAPRDALNVEEHSYTSEIIEVATCTSEGTAVFTCKKCGDSYSERIEPTSHSYISAVASEGNCSAKSIITYTCSACGDTYTEEGELKSGNSQRSYKWNFHCAYLYGKWGEDNLLFGMWIYRNRIYVSFGTRHV